MFREILLFLTIFVALAHHLGQSEAAELEAKLAGARLPTTLIRSAAVYDGIYNVYIFGGYVTEFVPITTKSCLHSI
jgi:hypothetical protein